MNKSRISLGKAILLSAAAFFGLVLLLYALPPVRERVNTRVQLWASEIQYTLNPPEQAVFIPQGPALDQPLGSTQTSTPLPSATPTETPLPEGPTETPEQTVTPTPTPTPLPASFKLEGVKYQHQHGLWNYCGPATLAMQVSYWGRPTDRLEAGDYLRGGRGRADDKNVMPYEMQSFVTEIAGLKMVVRVGGELELLKALVAAGFPVIIEKESILQSVGWLGHYLLVYGYDDAAGVFITMDSYHGEGSRYDYAYIQTTWRAFNYTFLVTYTDERADDLFAVLGPWGDETWAAHHALEIAQAEALTLTGVPRYFAWFNIGTSNVLLQSYFDAATAFDTSFQYYAELPTADRPWRMLWYSTYPYWAYFYTGRYYDVIALADQTLDSMTDPMLEESFYWRGLAKEAVGDWAGAVADIEESVRLNKNFTAGLRVLARMQGGG